MAGEKCRFFPLTETGGLPHWQNFVCTCTNVGIGVYSVYRERTHTPSAASSLTKLWPSLGKVHFAAKLSIFLLLPRTTAYLYFALCICYFSNFRGVCVIVLCGSHKWQTSQSVYQWFFTRWDRLILATSPSAPGLVLCAQQYLALSLGWPRTFWLFSCTIWLCTNGPL